MQNAAESTKMRDQICKYARLLKIMKRRAHFRANDCSKVPLSATS